MIRHDISPCVTVYNRCLIEPASRVLDGAVYCVVLGANDANSLASAMLIEVRLRGFILIEHRAMKVWAHAPPYTGDLDCAKSLLPEGLSTIAHDPRIVCATALMARAILKLPPLTLDRWRVDCPALPELAAR